MGRTVGSQNHTRHVRVQGTLAAPFDADGALPAGLTYTWTIKPFAATTSYYDDDDDDGDDDDGGAAADGTVTLMITSLNLTRGASLAVYDGGTSSSASQLLSLPANGGGGGGALASFSDAPARWVTSSGSVLTVQLKTDSADADGGADARKPGWFEARPSFVARR